MDKDWSISLKNSGAHFSSSQKYKFSLFVLAARKPKRQFSRGYQKFHFNYFTIAQILINNIFFLPPPQPDPFVNWDAYFWPRLLPFFLFKTCHILNLRWYANFWNPSSTFLKVHGLLLSLESFPWRKFNAAFIDFRQLVFRGFFLWECQEKIYAKCPQESSDEVFVYFVAENFLGKSSRG